ncbi:unnamed protein product [Vicia faba]|uniref:Uncharacterized protein n=1 Tax=Vicia faba TaxID=3906 RepID=A0AAV0ZZH3_VICFA|nr:unnamed protein product [Vicia faba]
MNIDGVEVGTISLLGRVCSKAGQITDVKFVLDDGTGMIECTKWLQEPADSIPMESILNGMPVTDFNEIAHHFLDCIYVHLYNLMFRASNPHQQHVPNSTQITPTRGHQFQAVSANQFLGQNNNDQKSVEQLVSDFLLLPQNREITEGTPHDVIREHLRIPLDRLKLAIENLTYEGQIYEGVTDRYKSAIDG